MLKLSMDLSQYQIQ